MEHSPARAVVGRSVCKLLGDTRGQCGDACGFVPAHQPRYDLVRACNQQRGELKKLFSELGFDP